MKREHDGENDDRGHRQKRYRSDGFTEALANGKFELRLLVSSKSAGAIIGKGGDNIKRLRSSFDAHIQVPDSNSPERVVTITAEPSIVVKLVEDVVSRLEDPPHDKDACELRVLVHQSHAGALIGRNGSKIKELREKCGARLKIFGTCCPNSTDRVLSTSGEVASCIKIVRCVIDELKELPIKGSSNQYSPFNYDPMLAPDYGGFIGGQSGGDRRSGPPARSGGGGGPRGSWNDRRSGGFGGRGDFGGPPGGYGGGYGGPPPYGGGPGSYGGGYGGPSPQVTTAQVTIPSDLGGTIIGRGGQRIQAIRDESGAQITLEQANGQSERIITITGTEHQIHSAQYLLQQCVRNSQVGRDRFGGPR